MNYFGLTFLLFLYFPANSHCGICDLCVCRRDENSKVVDCRGKGEKTEESRTEILDVLALLGEERGNRVEELIISNRELQSLPLDAFRGLDGLKSLDLSKNKLTELDGREFKNLAVLEHIDLSFNELERLNGAVFSSVGALLSLNVGNNGIVDFNGMRAGQLAKLRRLDLSHNGLISLEGEWIKSLSNLDYLDISFNRISSLSSGTLLPLSQLREFRASFNLLNETSGKDFPDSLDTLAIAGNRIRSHFIDNFPQLENLYIQENEIESMANASKCLGRLKRLNISGNSLISFPNEIFENLQILDLSRNKFTDVPETLSKANLPVLDTLAIDGNPIEKLRFNEELTVRKLFIRRLEKLRILEADTFFNVSGFNEECVYLTISHNPHLTQIDVGAFNNIPICCLDLSHNAIAKMSEEVIRSNGKFVGENGIDLQGNPFDCDCQSQWMLSDFLPHTYEKHLEFLEELRCKTPLELAGTRMVHWYRWKYQVFCDKSTLSRMKMESVLAAGGSIRLESSGAMLGIVAGAMGTLCILIIVGIVLGRKISIRRRRINRRL